MARLRRVCDQCSAGASASGGLEQSIAYYREQWQPEGGFHRFKGGELSALPIYLKYERRIRGLMTVLSLALRVITLVEFVVRRELRQQQTKIAGLYEGNPTRATDRPTTERMLRAFDGVVLYCVQSGEQVSYQLTPLTKVQAQILRLMPLPSDIYSRLVPDVQFANTT